MWAIGLAILLSGIILLVLCPVLKGNNKRCSGQSQGKVEEIRETNMDGSARDFYIYSYTVGGVVYTLETYEKSPQANNVGDECIIFYNPAKPKEAHAALASKTLMRALLISGIVMVPVGLIMILIGVSG